MIIRTAQKPLFLDLIPPPFSFLSSYKVQNSHEFETVRYGGMNQILFQESLGYRCCF